jgi:hypothetical protein
MSSKLLVNLEDLLRQRKVEGDRIDDKAGWIRTRFVAPSAPLPTTCEV